MPPASQAPSFLKAQDTTTSVDKSIADVRTLLARYGATGYGYDFDAWSWQYVVRFTLPRVGAADAHASVRVELPIRCQPVYDRLLALRKGTAAARDRDRDRLRAQAERVAWRNLLLWIDASLSLVALGAQTLEEAFHAHTLVRTADGQEGRMGDYVATLREASAGRLPSADELRRHLLPATTGGR